MSTKTQTATFEQTLKNYRAEIDQALSDFFKKEANSEILAQTEHGKQAFERLGEFALRPGKRLRGALAMFVYGSLTDKPNPSIINAALALELVQDYLLIIDDVMDRSKKRRGKPTVHELILAKDLAGKDRHLANMLAVNTGLLAAHMAQSVLLKVDEQPQNLINASDVLQRNIAVTAYGQIDDLYNDLNAAADEDQTISLYQRKNSYYSFISPMQLGAALAGRSDALAAAEIADIGLPAGVAFQLQDDILGLFGDEETTGKSSSDDLREGKYTLLILYALKRADAKGAEKIRHALGNQELTAFEAEQVRSIIRDSGALQEVAAKAQQFCTKSKEALISSTVFDEPSKQFLTQLVEFVVNRKA